MRRPCCDKQEINKGAWTKQEDQKLIDYVQKHGEGNWRSLPQAAGLLRCGKSCRLRWMNYLRPDIKRGNFAEDEDDLIIKLHALLGNRWSLIAGRLPGRTDNEVKNYWNSHLKRKLKSMGIDPNNHRIIDHKSHAVAISPFHLSLNQTPRSELDHGKGDSSMDDITTSQPPLLGAGKRSKSMLDLNLSLSTIPSALGKEIITKNVDRSPALTLKLFG